MRDQQVNTFGKGMMKDLSATTPQGGSYVDAQNIRIISDGSGAENASGIVVDIKGNEKVLDLSLTSFVSAPPWYSSWVSTGSLALTDGSDIVNGGYTSLAQGDVVNGSITYVWPEETYLLAQQGSNVNLYYNSSGSAIYLSAVGLGYSAGVFGASIQYMQLLLSTTLEGIELISQSSLPVLSFYEYLSESTTVSVNILGHTTIRDTLVLFSIATLESALGDSVEVGAVVKCSLNTNAPLVSESVYVSEHLNFDIDHPIEAVGRYESESIQRIYWTDGLNPVRTINISDPEAMNIAPDSLNINPTIDFSAITIEDVTHAGTLPAGMYQYGYRLISSGGAQTRFSPLTNFCHILKGASYWDYEEDPENQVEYSNTLPGVDTYKSVDLKMEGLDQDYDYVEVVAVYRTNSNGVAGCFLLPKISINAATAFVTHTSNDTPITIEEVTSFGSDINISKTLETKDNRLFLGNSQSREGQDLLFNARSYRYKRTDGSSRFPYLSLEDTVDSSTEDYETYVDELFDPINLTGSSSYSEVHNLNAINPFNSYNKEQAPLEELYRYQKDGVTLGGNGVYVDFKFKKQKLQGNTHGDGGIPASAPYVSGNIGSASSSIEDLDYKNPVVAANFKGYQRGEIYRFGIVLFDNYGNPGFTNWVGDIKFPDYEDFDWEGQEGVYNFTIAQNEKSASGTNYYLDNVVSAGDNNATANSHLYWPDGGSPNDNEYSRYNWQNGSYYDKPTGSLYALGIEFKLKDLPESLKNKVSGYKFVRTIRRLEDKTVVGTGMLQFLNVFKYQNGATFRWAHNGPMLYMGRQTQNKIWGSQFSHVFTIDSPDFNFKNVWPDQANNMFVKVSGGLVGRSEEDIHGTDSFVMASIMSAHVLKSPWRYDVFDLDYIGKFRRAEAKYFNIQDHPGVFYSTLPTTSDSSNGATFGDDDDFYGVQNRSLQGNNEDCVTEYSGVIDVAGVSEESLLAVLKPHRDDDDLLITHPAGTGSTADGTGWGINWVQYLHTMDTLSQPCSIGNGSFKLNRGDKILVTLKKELGGGQYGGSTEDLRRPTSYISTGAFVPYTNVTDTVTDVWGGDTYVTIYDIEKNRFHNSSIDDGSISGYNQSWNFAFPTESTVNTTLRGGYHFANKTDHEIGTDQELNQFVIEPTYSSENSTDVYIHRPLAYTPITKQDTRVNYSEEKVNNSLVDSWRVFKLENYKDVSGDFGELTGLMYNQDSLYFSQERAFGKLNINPVSTVVDEDGVSIVLGTGKVINSFSYISDMIGIQNIRSSVSTPKGVYWIDQVTRKAYAFRANGLDSISDTHGMKSWFSSNISKDSKITLGNDVINDEVLFSVDNTTIVFSEVINKFTSFYTYGTPMYINLFNRLLSIDPSNMSDIYNHNTGASCTFYGTSSDSYIEFLVNKHPVHTKVFDVIEWYTASIDNKFEEGIFSNNLESQVDTLSEAVNKERMTRMPVPRTDNFARFRDAYMKVKLTTSKEFTLHYVKTSFRISKR